MSQLKGTLGFKGERGYSAYDVAVQNGFEGTEQDWLSTLGTSSHFDKTSMVYTTVAENENTLVLPSEYKQNDSYIDLFIDGKKINDDEYSIDIETKKITLKNPIVTLGTKVEIVVLSCSTNNLPIVDTIDEKQTNQTTPGTKSVYDFVSNKISETYAKITEINTKLIFDTTVIEVEEVL